MRATILPMSGTSVRRDCRHAVHSLSDDLVQSAVVLRGMGILPMFGGFLKPRGKPAFAQALWPAGRPCHFRPDLQSTVNREMRPGHGLDRASSAVAEQEPDPDQFTGNAGHEDDVITERGFLPGSLSPFPPLPSVE